MGASARVVDVEMAAIQGLLERTKTLLPREDYELLQGLVGSFVELTSLVRKHGTTIARLRRLVGFVSSEKTADVLAGGPGVNGAGADPPGEAAPDTDKGSAPTGDEPSASGKAGDPDTHNTSRGKRKGHGRLPASAYSSASHIDVRHESLCPGQLCPGCACGRLFELQDPARFLRIVGQPPLVAVCWNCQRLRCGACGAVYTARAPDQAQGEKYTETAASMMALLRYGGGMPINRLQHLQRHLQTPVPTSTQWDVVNRCVDLVRPVYEELTRLAAQARVLHIDDSRMRILGLMGKRRAALLECNALDNPERTGLFTTAIVAITDAGRTIALFFTGRKHAGENLSELLKERATDLSPPIQMCDALSRNLPKGFQVLEANCIAHGRRKVVDEANNFPEECRHLLEQLGRVYKVDERCRKQELSDEQRLRIHQSESAPVMAELELWMQAQLFDKRVEPNSGMGDAINYMLKRWDKLTLFLREPGAPLDNNICERALKKAIQHRKNSLFYRSLHGAQVGDIFMTLIHTTELDGGNSFDYLTALQQHYKAVAETPADWLPWNYRDTLARLAMAETPQPNPAPTGRRPTPDPRPEAGSAPP